MSCRRCSVSGSIDSASISFSRMPIGSSNSSSSGIGSIAAVHASRRRTELLHRAVEAAARDWVLTRICGIDVGADAQRAAVLRATSQLDGDGPVALVGGEQVPQCFELLPACSRRSSGCARSSTAARAGSRAERSRWPACATTPRRARSVPRTATSAPFSMSEAKRPNGSGNTTTSTRALRVLEREDAHAVALLGLERAEARDDAADVHVLDEEPARRAVRRLRQLGEHEIADRAGAERAQVVGVAIERVAAQIEPERILLLLRAAPSRSTAAASGRRMSVSPLASSSPPPKRSAWP